MGAKKDLTKTISRQLVRILKKQERIEEIPVRLDNNIVVTPTEGHTIHAIGNCSSINITELGANFGVTKSAASQIVSKLSKK